MTLERLRAQRLVLRENEPLSARTTLRIGGPARLFAEVSDVAALEALLSHAAAEGLLLLPLGKGSNLLVPDEGFPGIAFVLSGDFRNVSIEGEVVAAGAGASLAALAAAAKEAGLSGLENLSGIPSSVGGAVRINAGSYGSEIFDVLVSVELLARTGARSVRRMADIPHGYRWTALLEGDDIVAGATLRLVPKPAERIAARMAEVTERRRKALPREPNAGSIFKNPPGDFAGRLLEACGMKGRRVGDAEVSPVHANVIVNLGGATAKDVRALMVEMREAVRARFGVELTPEIELLGEPLS